MEARAVSCFCQGSTLRAEAAVTRSTANWQETIGSSASSSAFFVRSIPASAILRVQGTNAKEVISRRDEKGPRRRSRTKVFYSPRSNSVAEAQSRQELMSSNSSALAQEGSKEEKIEDRPNHAEGDSVDMEKAFQMWRVCDRLIEVFMIERTTPAEWRKLLAFSAEWPNIRPYFFDRCKSNATAEEDPRRRGDLLKLARQLKQVDEDMVQHDKLLEEIEKNESLLDTVVAKRRKDFTGDFFDHLHTLCDANYKNLERRDAIAALSKKILSAVERHDADEVDSDNLAQAQLKFDDILQSPSLEAAVNKIDKLAQKQQLDSSLMLLFTKAWAAAKESTMMKEEVKDVMLHLYKVAQGNMQRLVSKEVRILRHLLSFRDPLELRAALESAFSPGNEIEGTDEDLLYTTPEKLLNWIKIVLDAYRTDRQTALVKEAQKLMNPEIIQRVEILRKFIEDNFT